MSPLLDAIHKPRVLDVVIPCFDSFVAEQGIAVPTTAKPIMPLSLRPALLAAVAIVERSGAKIIADSTVERWALTTRISA